MVKVNFLEVEIKNVEGKDIKVKVDYKDLGNALYMNGRHISICQLGQKIWNSDGTIELSNEEAKSLTEKVTEMYSLVIQEGLKKQLIINK